MNKIYTVLVAALFAVALIGCKKDEGATAEGTGTASTTGSSTTPVLEGKAAAVGTWKLDTASIQGDGPKTDQQKKDAETMAFEFKDDGNFTLSMGTPSQELMKGTFTVEGKNVKLAPEKVADAKDIPTMTISEDGKTLRMDDTKTKMDFKKS